MRLLGLVLIIATALWTSPGTLVPRYQTADAARAVCGTERQDVKTLADPAAHAVDFTPRQATVEQLAALPVPGPIALHIPRYSVETRTYQVSARLVGYKLEADSDFHVVVAGSSGLTMIVEIPDPACTGALQHAAMAKARADFIRLFGQPTKRFTRVATIQPIIVTGVVFFDLCHGQTGRAPNCVELHPVLAVSR